MDSRYHQELQEAVSELFLVTIAVVHELLVGVEGEGLGGEADVGVDAGSGGGDAGGEEFVED